jgi:hypothetical protein
VPPLATRKGAQIPGRLLTPRANLSCPPLGGDDHRIKDPRDRPSQLLVCSDQRRHLVPSGGQTPHPRTPGARRSAHQGRRRPHLHRSPSAPMHPYRVPTSVCSRRDARPMHVGLLVAPRVLSEGRRKADLGMLGQRRPQTTGPPLGVATAPARVLAGLVGVADMCSEGWSGPVLVNPILSAATDKTCRSEARSTEPTGMRCRLASRLLRAHTTTHCGDGSSQRVDRRTNASTYSLPASPDS